MTLPFKQWTHAVAPRLSIIHPNENKPRISKTILNPYREGLLFLWIVSGFPNTRNAPFNRSIGMDSVRTLEYMLWFPVRFNSVLNICFEKSMRNIFILSNILFQSYQFFFNPVFDIISPRIK